MTNNYDLIEIRAIKSYKGITFSFDSTEVYDLYYVYMKCEDKFEFIADSKSLLLSNPKFIENELYYVDGFKLENGEYILKGKSNVYKCHTIEKKKDFEKPLISIVCPMFNAYTCISNCIDSILLSTLDKIELIIVDDGSTDNSKVIIDWYLINYPDLIKYYYQENKGVSFARNMGLKNVCGVYTGFIDSDDYVHPRMYEELLKALQNNNCNIAIGKTILIDQNSNISIILDVPNKNNDDSFSISYEEMINYKNSGSSMNIYFVSSCHLLVKTDIVINHPFPNFNHYEDIAFTRMLYSFFDRLAFSHKAYYVWDQRIRNTVGSESIRNYIKKYEDKYEIHRKFFRAHLYGYKEGSIEKKEILSYDVINDLYYYLKCGNFLNQDNDLYKIVINEIKNYFDKNYLLSNKYIIGNNELKRFIENI